MHFILFLIFPKWTFFLLKLFSAHRCFFCFGSSNYGANCERMDCVFAEIGVIDLNSSNFTKWNQLIALRSFLQALILTNLLRVVPIFMTSRMKDINSCESVIAVKK